MKAIEIDRICRGAVLFPGTRLIGARTFVGPGAKVGSEGPAVLEDTLIVANAEIAGGHLKETVMLRDSRVGANAAHAVGLRQTILMSFGRQAGSFILISRREGSMAIRPRRPWWEM
jgi:UDP-N-acetylglucosamine/UDP-N-acetylgalactosamine diphosphorylase